VKNCTANRVYLYTATTPPTGTTLIRVGIYSVNRSTGELTALIASSANDTTLLNTNNSAVGANLTTPVALTAGNRYCVALLVVATGVPKMIGAIGAGPAGSVPADSPSWVRTSASASLTDLPASLTGAQVISDGTNYLMKIAIV
jgi:hypothetical protein